MSPADTVRIRGTRVLVSVVLDNLAAGEAPEAIARDYHLTLEDVQAALLFGDGVGSREDRER